MELGFVDSGLLVGQLINGRQKIKERLTITGETQLLPTMCIFHLAGSVLHCSFSFIISFAHVGQISFQNQPNAINTNVSANALRVLGQILHDNKSND